jgi:hypothetical protein
MTAAVNTNITNYYKKKSFIHSYYLVIVGLLLTNKVVVFGSSLLATDCDSIFPNGLGVVWDVNSGNDLTNSLKKGQY